jgi:outer membrane protein OmpA-like peptidoglycan-associated protein
MQRRNRTYAFISALALLTWFAAGSYYVAETCCGNATAVQTPLPAITSSGIFLIEDGEDFRVESDQTIVFAANDARPILYEKVSESMMKTIEYVKSNPLKIITITGLFAHSEKGGLELAKNRADSIRKLFLSGGTPAYQLNVQAGQKDNLIIDEKQNMVLSAVEFSFSCIAPFDILDEKTKFQLQTNNNLIFKFSTNNFLMQPADELNKELRKLAAYLQNQPSRKLVLTGYNHPDEKNGTALVNLGKGRANIIRKILMDFGAKGTQIETKGIQEERIAVIQSSLYGQFLPNSVGFEFEPLSRQYTQFLKNEKRRIEKNFKEIQVFRFKNFKKQGHEIIVDVKTKTYLNDLILYLCINERAKVFCVGHSNAMKSADKGFEIASDRALYTQEFLIKHGISSDRIVIKSAGATHPLGEETTKYGQQINRRVDLFISYNGKTPKLYVFPPKLKDNKSKVKKNARKKSSSGKNKVKKNTVKKNTEKKNTEKNNTEKNNTEKNNTEKNNTEKNNTEKNNTEKKNTENKKSEEIIIDTEVNISVTDTSSVVNENLLNEKSDSTQLSPDLIQPVLTEEKKDTL